MHTNRQQEGSNGSFEIERNGQVAHLDYAIEGKVIALLHTEVPHELRGQGLGSQLAKQALDWARDHQMKVDVVCEFVAIYLKRHPEYSDLVVD